MTSNWRSILFSTFLCIAQITLLYGKPQGGDTEVQGTGYFVGKLTVYIALAVVAIVVIRKLKKQ